MVEEGLYKNSDSENSDLGPKRKKKKTRTKEKKITKNSVAGKAVSKQVKDKKLKRVKPTEKSVNMNADICIFCKDSKPLTKNSNSIKLETEILKVVKCIPCKKTFHLDCLESHIRSITESSNIEPSINLLNALNDPNTLLYNPENKQCINCSVDLVDCFVCKNVGKRKTKIDARVQKNVREAILNSTRSMQRDDSSAFLYEELGNKSIFF